jgi:pectin methylesterase-like acyl-CoA thioesterase
VNNNNLNPSTRGRALFGLENVTDFLIQGVTIHNQTPQGGSQAEALALLSCDKCIVRDTTVRSLQDTLLWSGRIYADNCLIEGNVDYIWGSGTAYFNQCEIKTVGRKGYNIQARNGSNYGYVFVDSKLTADAGIVDDVLARIDVTAYPSSHVAYIDCEMGSHISAAGWAITGGGSTTNLRFWEYKSRTPQGGLVNTSGRAAGSKQISDAQAAQMRDPTVVLAGWNPQ